jgi:hypothetical protein
MLPLLVILVLSAMLAVSRGAEQPDQAELAHVASLHRSVYELQTLPSSPVHAAARELGLRYIEGRGVERDPIQGCALIERAIWDSATAPREDAAARADAEGLKKLHCSGLSTNQNEEAWQLAGCGIFGVTPQVIALAPGSQIDISRRGLVLDTPAGRRTQPLNGPVGCDNQVALLRYAHVDSPVGLALPSRHLLEVAEWRSAPGTAGTRRALLWYLFDITSKIEVVAVGTLEEDAGSAWPMPPLPAGLERGTTFTMQPSGAIRWEIPGEPAHRGAFSE